MKGDYSRNTFDSDKRHTGVRLQQGRVVLDADWNEQVDIQNHLRQTGFTDLIGPHGVPSAQPESFKVVNENGKLKVRRGRMWVGGVLCRQEGDISIDPGRGRTLVYLEVWQQHVTAVEDPAIRELALGGPDTSTRTRTVCAVRTMTLGDDQDCSLVDSAWRPSESTDGTLIAEAKPVDDASEPCGVPSDAGYTGLENHLYRIEIHDGGSTSGQKIPTFKWSRDNGSVVTEWLSREASVLTAKSLGADDVRGFRKLPLFVELGDDSTDLDGPGNLVEIEKVEPTADGGGLLTVAASDAGDLFDPEADKHPKLRRWEDNAKPIVPSQAEKLENGIEIRFSPGTYRSGDYWLIPARAFIGEHRGSIAWPHNSTGSPIPAAKHGIERRYAALAVVAHRSARSLDIEDCRTCFDPVTKRRLFALSGTGQQAMPGRTLPCELRVLALVGGCPDADARVRFECTAGTFRSGRRNVQTVQVPTNAEGIATVPWRMPTSLGELACLKATATLVDRKGSIGDPVEFTAGISIASDVAYTPNPESCPELSKATTVQDAIDRLCERDTEGGMHIKSVHPMGDSSSIDNDSVVDIQRITRGIRIQCDREVDGSFFAPPAGASTAKPILKVTIYVPLSDFGTPLGKGAGSVPLTPHGSIAAVENVITWKPKDLEAFAKLFEKLSKNEMWLVEVELRGNFVWHVDQKGRLTYLDGEAFGHRPKGHQGNRMPLDFTGNGLRGGDFRMWFWVGTTPAIKLVAKGHEGGLDGTVKDPEGKPIPGANINLTGRATRETSSNDKGVFSFEGLPGGVYKVEATFTGMKSADLQVTVPKPKIRLSATGLVGGIGGSVKDREEKPIKGATIKLSGRAARQTSSNEKGVFAFGSLAAGNYKVVATFKDMEKAEQDVTVLPPPGRGGGGVDPFGGGRDPLGGGGGRNPIG